MQFHENQIWEESMISMQSAFLHKQQGNKLMILLSHASVYDACYELLLMPSEHQQLGGGMMSKGLQMTSTTRAA